MADIVVTIDETGLGSSINVISGTGSVLSDGGLPVLSSSMLSNPLSLDTISAIGDVDTTALNNGAVLVYKTTTNKWTSTTTLDAQNMEGGEF
jgi:hypothetical protein